MKSLAKLKPRPLHDLAFGCSIAKTERSVINLQERMALAQGWDSHYDAVGDTSLFATQTASLQLKDLRLTAISHSPFQSKVVVKNSCTLVVPLQGEHSVSQINGKSILMAPGVSAAFAPPGERIGRGGYRSVLMADLDLMRLQSTWSTMLGEGSQSQRMIDVSSPQQLSLRELGKTIPHLCGIVDQLCSTPQSLVELGIDEHFYRLAVMLLQRDQPSECEGAPSAFASRKRLDLACQFAIANLTKTITLTELERAANLSSRALQYGFLRHFDCTPMQWVRNQRYSKVQQLLLSAEPDTTVKSAAMAFGFFSASKLAAGYLQRFGELPSATLLKAKR